MRDPFSWSLPLGRLFGISIRVHLLFLVIIPGLILRAMYTEGAPDGIGLAMTVLLILLFFSVLLHEFGHCFAARSVDGDANEILLWPLGGLAYCDIPNSPRAHFLTAAGGPAVNLLLCFISGAALAAIGFVPSFNPLPTQALNTILDNWRNGDTYGSHFAMMVAPQLGVDRQLEYWQYLLAQFFWVNWFLLLLNVLLMAFPLDGGRMLQAALWPRVGYRQSMLAAVFVGFLMMIAVGILGLAINDTLPLCLAVIIGFSCKKEWVMLETGGEESLFGYDFSQGYTSLERDENIQQTRKKRPNFIQRWLQRRAARKVQREMEKTEAEERRMDELLDKIAKTGKESLTEEEQRFLKRVSDRYRNRP